MKRPPFDFAPLIGLMPEHLNPLRELFVRLPLLNVSARWHTGFRRPFSVAASDAAGCVIQNNRLQLSFRRRHHLTDHVECLPYGFDVFIA